MGCGWAAATAASNLGRGMGLVTLCPSESTILTSDLLPPKLLPVPSYPKCAAPADRQVLEYYYRRHLESLWLGSQLRKLSLLPQTH